MHPLMIAYLKHWFKLQASWVKVMDKEWSARSRYGTGSGK